MFKHLLLAVGLLSCVLAFANDANTTISVILPGFNPDGSTQEGLFGVPHSDEMITKMAAILGLPDGSKNAKAPNQIVEVRYYGTVSPEYYTAQDTAEVNAAERGTPRYALIAAKFIKQLFVTTGATQVNLGGGSFGGLISRYMIEHDVEGLASSGKIARWLTIEGAVNGAYPANLTADKELAEFVMKELGWDIADPLTMSHVWVEKNIANPRDETKCPHFKNILVGHQISSNDNLNEQALTLVSDVANDGVLLVQDMAIHNMPEDCRFHSKLPATVISDTTHMSVKQDPSLLLNVASFMRGSKRVTVRIVKAKAIDFNEDEILFGRGEIAFQGNVRSLAGEKIWGITTPMAVVNASNHTAPVYKFEKGETKPIATTLFDWMVLPEEQSLELTVSASELDWDDVYNISENIFEPSQDLGSAVIEVPLPAKGKSFPVIRTEKWEAHLEVEVYDYGF